MNPQFILDQHRDVIISTAARYGVHNVRVFGSVARGEATDESDIDLLVSLESGRSLLDLGGLLFELEQILGVRVDIVTEKGLRKRIRDEVLRDAVPL